MVIHEVVRELEEALHNLERVIGAAQPVLRDCERVLDELLMASDATKAGETKEEGGSGKENIVPGAGDGDEAT